MTDETLIVLAECVDIRTGRRFAAGETFEPVPAVEQAHRLILAGCLPEKALGEAEKVAAAHAAPTDDKAAAADAAKQKKAEKKAAAASEELEKLTK